MSQPFKPLLQEVRQVQEVLNMKELSDAVQKSSDQEVLSAKNQMVAYMQKLNEKYKNVNLNPLKPTATVSTIEFIPTKEPFPQFGLLYSSAKPDP